MKKALAAFGLSFVIIAVGNAGSHGTFLAATVSDAVVAIAPTPGGPSTFIWLFVVWTLIAVGTAYFVSRDRELTNGRAAMAGALVGLLADGSWNVINRAMWPQWPTPTLVLDSAWHTAHGAVTGLAVAWLLRRFEHSSKQA